MKFSDQANIIIKHLKNFDIEDFEIWHKKDYSVGSIDVLNYLLSKGDK